MNKELEELDRENWKLLSAVKYFREEYLKLREENKWLRSRIQELGRLSDGRK